MSMPITPPGRRAAAYWFVDGLPEMAFGLPLLLFGLLAVWATARGNPHGWEVWLPVGVMLSYLLVLVMFIMHRRVLDALKARVTYPRTGYVRPPVDFPGKTDSLAKIHTFGTRVDENISTFRSHTVFLFVIGCPIQQFFDTPWSLPFVMAGIATGVFFWNRDGIHPYSLPAVLPIALGGVLAPILHMGPAVCWFMPMVIGGAWLLGVGSWTFVRYLRAYPRPDAGGEGR